MASDGIIPSGLANYYDDFDFLVESNNDTLGNSIMLQGDYTEVTRRLEAARQEQQRRLNEDPSMHPDAQLTIY